MKTKTMTKKINENEDHDQIRLLGENQHANVYQQFPIFARALYRGLALTLKVGSHAKI